MENIFNHKIQMIKSLRAVTRLLGKVGVSSLRREETMWTYQQKWKAQNPKETPREWPRYSYGLGLKESKDLTERYIDRVIKLRNSVHSHTNA